LIAEKDEDQTSASKINSATFRFCSLTKHLPASDYAITHLKIPAS